MKLYPSASFALVSKGTHPAVCCEFVDLGKVETNWGRKHKGMWVFQVDETEENGRRKEVYCKFNLSVGALSQPTKVQRLMGQWRGRAYSLEEVKNGHVDPEKPVGHACRLEIEHATMEDGAVIHYVEHVRPPAETRLEPAGYKPLAGRIEGGPDEEGEDGGVSPAPVAPSPSPASARVSSEVKADRPPF